MIIFLCIIQIILSIIIGASIIFSKASGGSVGSITNNFMGGGLNSKSKLNIRPRTKLMFVFVALFFANSIFLTKKINYQNPNKSSLIIDSSKKKDSYKQNESNESKNENKVPF
jgi:preprotein translocase subunit SecG